MATPFPFVAGAVLQAAELNAITTLPLNDQTANYTLVVGDVGKRVVMNVAGANTVTVNDAIFGVGDTVQIVNKGAGVSTVTAGAGVTINTSDSLALAQYQSGTLVALSASTFLFFPTAEAITVPSVGLVCVKAETAFSAASSVTVDNVFTSTYTNYKVLINYETSGTGNELRLKLRVGGVSASTNYNLQQIIFDNTTSFSSRSTSQTSFVLGGQTNGSFKSAVSLEIFRPQLAEPTSFIASNAPNQGAYTTPQADINCGNHSTATAYDGFELLTTANDTTGTYTVYGYAKTL